MPQPLADRFVMKSVLLCCLAGKPSYQVDGVTAGGKHFAMTTQTKGSRARFVALHELGRKSHCTEDEADAVAKTINDEDALVGNKSAGTSVDNAAISMAQLLKKKLKNPKNIVQRDPAHSTDLYAKDVAQVRTTHQQPRKKNPLWGFLRIS